MILTVWTAESNIFFFICSKPFKWISGLRLTKIIATWENLSYVWHIYDKPLSSNKIFCKINVATVLLNSEPDSMIRKHNGMISVVRRNVITSCSSVYMCQCKDVHDANEEKKTIKLVIRLLILSHSNAAYGNMRPLIYLNKCSNHTETCQSQILEWPSFWCCMQERI